MCWLYNAYINTAHCAFVLRYTDGIYFIHLYPIVLLFVSWPTSKFVLSSDFSCILNFCFIISPPANCLLPLSSCNLTEDLLYNYHYIRMSRVLVLLLHHSSSLVWFQWEVSDSISNLWRQLFMYPERENNSMSRSINNIWHPTIPRKSVMCFSFSYWIYMLQVFHI
jgi:hypothetical protein